MPWVFREAFRTVREARPGPVLIDLPLDVQKGLLEYDPSADTPLPFVKPEPNPALISKALDLFLAAEKPVMLLGGGVVVAEGWSEFVELAELLQVPVATSYMGARYDGQMVDLVKIAEGFGAYGERVTEPGADQRYAAPAVESGRLAVVDIIVEQNTDCSMGVSIDSIRKFV